MTLLEAVFGWIYCTTKNKFWDLFLQTHGLSPSEGAGAAEGIRILQSGSYGMTQVLLFLLLCRSFPTQFPGMLVEAIRGSASIFLWNSFEKTLQ